MCAGASFHAETASQLIISGKGDHSLETASIYCPVKGDCIIDIYNGNDALNKIDIYINDPKKVNLQPKIFLGDTFSLRLDGSRKTT